jgi:hypothetical protein
VDQAIKDLADRDMAKALLQLREQGVPRNLSLLRARSPPMKMRMLWTWISKTWAASVPFRVTPVVRAL